MITVTTGTNPPTVTLHAPHREPLILRSREGVVALLHALVEALKRWPA